MKKPSLNYYNIGSIATQSIIPPKALPLLVCTKNTVLGDVSRDKYSTWLRLVLYLSFDRPPRAVFSIQTRGSALSNIYIPTCVYTPSWRVDYIPCSFTSFHVKLDILLDCWEVWYLRYANHLLCFSNPDS